MEKMSNRLPVGPGSRGGKWHDPEYRKIYHRAWRAAHPDYRDRERLRKYRKRSGDNETASPPTFPRPLPLAQAICACACGCKMEMYNVCGFCQGGNHWEPGDE